MRSQPVLEHLAGCFINTLPLRISVPFKGSFKEAMRRAHVDLLQALEHADVPFQRIVQELGIVRPSSHNLIFQTIVQLLPRRPTNGE